jgi:3-mercaptopyruvate sulfurtransferase SseA
VALLLRRRGIERVRPLAGGLYGWRDRGYPTVDIVPATTPAAARVSATA